MFTRNLNKARSLQIRANPSLREQYVLRAPRAPRAPQISRFMIGEKKFIPTNNVKKILFKLSRK